MAGITAITTGANFAFELANCEDEFQPLTLVFSATYLFSALLLLPNLDLAPLRPAQSLGLPAHLRDPLRQTLPQPGLSHNPLVGPLSRLLYLGG